MAQQGKLKWYNHVKGYGFLSREEGQKDLFVHVSEFRKAGIKKIVEQRWFCLFLIMWVLHIGRCRRRG